VGSLDCWGLPGPLSPSLLPPLGRATDSHASGTAVVQLRLRMKTERKYSEPAVFIFYIMILFLNIKKLLNSIGFTTIFNHFLYSLIAKM
jgi:hypothetical protein